MVLRLFWFPEVGLCHEALQPKLLHSSSHLWVCSHWHQPPEDAPVATARRPQAARLQQLRVPTSITRWAGVCIPSKALQAGHTHGTSVHTQSTHRTRHWETQTGLQQLMFVTQDQLNCFQGTFGIFTTIITLQRHNSQVFRIVSTSTR